MCVEALLLRGSGDEGWRRGLSPTGYARGMTLHPVERPILALWFWPFVLALTGCPTPKAAVDSDTAPDFANVDAVLYGESAGDESGISLSAAGDMDGDGYDDVLVGAIGDANGGTGSGATYLVHGPISGVASLAVADAKITGDDVGGSSGYAVAGNFDADGDGSPDILIGAPGVSPKGTGAAYLVLGPVTGTVSLAAADATFTGEHLSARAGDCVAAGGDVDDDGYDDMLISSPGGAGHPSIYVMSGAKAGTASLSTANAAIRADSSADASESSVASAGDVDGDGISDLILLPVSGSRAAYLVLGPVSGSVSLNSADAEFNGGAALNSVAGPGDVDGDGRDDLAVASADDPDGGIGAGAAYLLFGAQTGHADIDTADAKILGESRDRLGTSLGSPGDLDVDGYADLLLGAQRYSGDPGPFSGCAYLLRGPISGVAKVGDVASRLVAGSQRDVVGYAATGAGDVDGDGLPDLLIGAPGMSTPASGNGAAYVLLNGSLF